MAAGGMLVKRVSAVDREASGSFDRCRPGTEVLDRRSMATVLHAEGLSEEVVEMIRRWDDLAEEVRMILVGVAGLVDEARRRAGQSGGIENEGLRAKSRLTRFGRSAIIRQSSNWSPW